MDIILSQGSYNVPLTLAGPAQTQALHLFALLSSPLFGAEMEMQALILCRRSGQVTRQWATKRGLMILWMEWSCKVRLFRRLFSLD